MEGELWKQVYRIVMEVGKGYPRKYQQYSDARIAMIYLWAVLHDRPVSWACQKQSWP